MGPGQRETGAGRHGTSGSGDEPEDRLLVPGPRNAAVREVPAGAELALARYNAGESRADKWKPAKFDGDVIDRIRIASTKRYVTKIMERYRNYLEEERRQQ